MFKTQPKQGVVIFDGICGLCNKSLKLLMKLDKEKILKYTSLQGEYVKGLALKDEIDSIVFYQDNILYYKSTAILKILHSLGGIWNMSYIFYIIPPFIRDFIYDIIAKYRYHIFGKVMYCHMQKIDTEELFIK